MLPHIIEIQSNYMYTQRCAHPPFLSCFLKSCVMTVLKYRLQKTTPTRKATCHVPVVLNTSKCMYSVYMY